MRTEVKLALVVATAMIAGGIYWASRQVGTGKTQGEIPLDGKKIEQNSTGGGAKGPGGGTPTGGVKGPTNTPPAGPLRTTPPRSTPSAATTQQPPNPAVGAPSAAHREAAPQDAQARPPAEGPRLPPLANEPRGTSEPIRPATPLTAPPANAVTSAPADTRPVLTPESSGPRGPGTASPESRPPSSPPPLTSPTREPGVAAPPLKETPTRGDDINSRLQPMEKPQPGAAGQPPPASTGGSKTYTVQEGDTLSSIARELLGDENLWPRIAAANPGIDPDLVKVGQALNIPGKDGAAKPATTGGTVAAPGRPNGALKSGAPPATGSGTAPASPAPVDAVRGEPALKAGGSTYVVGKGDTLRSIARNVLKDASKWRQIYDLNRDKLESPDVISEGTELRLPPLNGAAKAPPPAGRAAKPPAGGNGKAAGNGATKTAKPASKPSSTNGGARR